MMSPHWPTIALLGLLAACSDTGPTASWQSLMSSQCDGTVRGSVCVGAAGTSILQPDGTLAKKEPGCHRTYGGGFVCFSD